MTWYHRTCSHSAERIGESGLLHPNPSVVLGGIPLVWLTSSRLASRSALGLSSHTLSCDRMEYLYQVTPEDEDHVMSWAAVKRLEWFAPFLGGAMRLEAVRGTRPVLWGVSGAPLHVERVT